MSNKWAIVTGASGGIGLSIARQLAGNYGYSLVLVARSADNLKNIKSELQTPTTEVQIAALDLSLPDAPEQLAQFTDQLGIIPEVLVNNAGVGHYGRFLDTELPDQLKMLQLNVNSLVALSHLYGKRMLERQYGYILQVASTAAFQPLPFYGLYGGTKSLVLSFSRTLNFEYGAKGISSTALCPGPTATNFFNSKSGEPSVELKNLMMSADDVATQGLEAMFARRELCITGNVNKFGVLASRVIPARLLMRLTAQVMR